MRALPFATGAILGGAFVAAIFHDPFRDFCRKGIVAVGAEVQKQLASVANDVKKTIDVPATPREKVNECEQSVSVGAS